MRQHPTFWFLRSYGTPNFCLHLINIDSYNKLLKDVQGGTLNANEVVENAFSKVYNETFNKIVEEEWAACSL